LADEGLTWSGLQRDGRFSASVCGAGFQHPRRFPNRRHLGWRFHCWFSFRQGCWVRTCAGWRRLTALGGSVAFLDLVGEIRMVFRQPLFLLMQHLDCLVDEFIGGTIRAAFHVVLDEGLQFRL